jgi:universal stress protein E
MATGTRAVMVAVRDLDASSHGLLRKAAALAKQRRAPLHMVHAIGLPYAPLHASMASVREAAHAELDDRRKLLLKLARRLKLKGVRTMASVTWDFPVADAIVRLVLRHRPQLLLVESHRHGRFARMWLTNTDWELIRHCPCPLWLSKTMTLPARGTVIAALDPYHAHAKPAGLDDVILRQAVATAGSDASRVVAAHVQFVPPSVASEGTIEAYWIALSDEERAAFHTDALKRISRLAARYQLPPKNLVALQGDPSFHLPRVAVRHKAALLVMGAVSRSGLERIFIGSTAERVLDHISCDVLIVKPRGFTSGVPRRAPRG